MKKILFVLLALSCASVNAADFKKPLNGKDLILQGHNCAGISLKNTSGLLGDGSGKCGVELATKLKWIDGDSFILIEKNRLNETSPPRTYLYKVKSVNGNKAVLTEIWTGWNNFPDENISYIIKN